MRRDFILALVVSLLIHGGVAGLGQLFKRPAAHILRPPEPPFVEIPMPPLDPDPPEIVDKHDDSLTAADFAPPTLPDAPQPPTPDAFLQPLEPPRPDVRPDTRVTIIPPGASGPRTTVEIFDPTVLERQPEATYQAKPVYPFEPRRAGITGEVLVGFIVDANGAVQNAFAVSSTDSAFEASAIHAVTQWKFKPGRKGGRAANTRMQVPIVFNISDGTN